MMCKKTIFFYYMCKNIIIIILLLMLIDDKVEIKVTNKCENHLKAIPKTIPFSC